MKVKVAKWGNSLGVRLPKAAAEAAGIEAGTELDIVAEGADLRLRRSSRIPYYRLEDMVAEAKRLGPEFEPETIDWGSDRGAEIIDDAYSRGEITFDDRAKRGKETKRDKPARGRKQAYAPGRRRHRLG
jgi:antitoxin MazE